MNRLVPVLAAALAAAALVPFGSAATGPSHIALALPATTSQYVDLGRKGYSPGDYFLSKGRLLRVGSSKQAGELGGVWTILSRQADHVSFDLGLADGTIFVTGQIRHTAPTSTLAVTGGTGRYVSARGTVTFRYASQTSARLDVRLSTSR
jgi:hypothetical protein